MYHPSPIPLDITFADHFWHLVLIIKVLLRHLWPVYVILILLLIKVVINKEKIIKRKKYMQSQVEIERQAVLVAKQSAHASNASNPALTDAERAELTALEAKE